MPTSLQLLLQALLVLSVAYSMHNILTPPSSTSQIKHQKSSQNQKYLSKRNLIPPTILKQIFKHAIWAHASAELYLILLSTPHQGKHPPPTHISYPLPRILGALLILLGAQIHKASTRALGALFVPQPPFVPQTQTRPKPPGSDLVKTGPYSYVRHPGYLGVLLAYTGALLWHGVHGAWLRESKFYHTKAALPILIPMGLLYCFILYTIATRPKKEDEILRFRFRKKWKRWAKAVPYRIIPGLY